MVEHEESVKNDLGAQKESGSKWTGMKKTLTNKEIMSQAVLFLAAGYETTASNLTLVAYNLAMNPEYQDKLCEEIDEVLERHVRVNNSLRIPYRRFLKNLLKSSRKERSTMTRSPR